MLAGTMRSGPSVGKLPSAEVSRIVLHGRRLNQVSVRLAPTLTLHPTLFDHYTRPLNSAALVPLQYVVGSVSELLTAILNESVDRIEVQAGTYMYTGNMNGTCSSAAICISRTLTIEAEVPGAVVLNAANEGRVFRILPGGMAKLIGLNLVKYSSSNRLVHGMT